MYIYIYIYIYCSNRWAPIWPRYSPGEELLVGVTTRSAKHTQTFRRRFQIPVFFVWSKPWGHTWHRFLSAYVLPLSCVESLMNDTIICCCALPRLHASIPCTYGKYNAHTRWVVYYYITYWSAEQTVVSSSFQFQLKTSSPAVANTMLSIKRTPPTTTAVEMHRSSPFFWTSKSSSSSSIVKAHATDTYWMHYIDKQTHTNLKRREHETTWQNK